MKKLALIIGLFLFILPVKHANAAVVTCAVWDSPAAGLQCVQGQQNCPAGQKPQANCGQFDAGNCPSTINCIPVNASPTPLPGACGNFGEKCCSDPTGINPIPTCNNNLPCNQGICAANPYAAQQKRVCDYAGDKKTECEQCFSKNPPEAWTAIGCIPTTPPGFIGKFLSLGIGIAGGLAFLLILFGGLQILTSAGNPERLNAGKELLTSAISGLILVALSLFLLQLIGFKILQIPGFG